MYSLQRSILWHPRAWRRLKWTGRIAVTVLVVYAANRAVSMRDMVALFGKLNAWGLAAVVILGIVGILLHAGRWRMALASQGIDIPRFSAMRTYLWGVSLALVTPARVGEFARGVGLPDVRRLMTVVAAGVERFYLSAATVAAGCIGWGVQLFTRDSLSSARLWLGALWLFFFAVGWTAVAWRGPLPRALPRPLAALASAWDGLRTAHARQGGLMLLNALCAHMTLIAQTSLLLWMLGGGGFAAAVFASCQAYALMLALPLSIGNMGVREFALSVFWTGAAAGAGDGGSAPVCLGTSMVILCVNIVAPAVAGTAWAAAAQLSNRPCVHEKEDAQAWLQSP